MPTFRAEQLIRDGRLKWMEENGVKVKYTQLRKPDLVHALRTKLMEEATEAALEDLPEELMKELADVLEVAFSLAREIGASDEELLAKMKERRAQFGSFEKGIMSESVSMPADHPNIPHYREYPEKYPEIVEENYDA